MSLVSPPPKYPIPIYVLLPGAGSRGLLQPCKGWESVFAVQLSSPDSGAVKGEAVEDD